MKLYNFFRSGTSHRLRIALNLKGLVPALLPTDVMLGITSGGDLWRLSGRTGLRCSQ
jgi:maleylpyruvate isomerase